MQKLLVALLICATAATLTSCSGGGGGDYKTGLGIVTHIDSSAAVTADAEGKGQVDSYIAVISLDASGKITKCSLDVAQTAVNFDAAGAITSDLSAGIRSKQEKQDDYGMKKASPIGKEWWEQADALEQYCIGKTVADVVGLRTKETEEGPVPDVPELATSVTIGVEAFLQAIDKAAANAQ
ncbi:MAG: hypothetical protein LBL96_08070 [Clostridiales bacterium]|jgi:hypothetical protein|nr:hypothetical protein [Clostridiales bacterium]